jgi:hypothetical protein
VADIIKRPAIGPTKSNTDAADRLDAAISNPDYLCPPVGAIEHILSSTLYPVPQIDAIVFGISVDGGAMYPLPSSDLKHTFEALGGTLIQTRWFYYDGPYDSDLKHTFEALGGTLIQTRWFYYDGPYDSDLKHTFEALDGTLVNKLVEADTPDEGLQMSAVIENTCTMDAI